MLKSEFIERTGFEPTAEEYAEIEERYYNFDGDKDAFCIFQWVPILLLTEPLKHSFHPFSSLPFVRGFVFPCLTYTIIHYKMYFVKCFLIKNKNFFEIFKK